MSKHHYIPRFFLSAWHSGKDDRLTRFSWINGALHAERKKAKTVAREPGLYAVTGATEQDVVERGFFHHLDTQAARVHQKMLGAGPMSLTQGERHVWAMFVVSLMLRTPTRVEEIRQRGKDALQAEFVKDPEEYEALRGVTDPATLTEFTCRRLPTLAHDFGVIHLPTLIQSPTINGVVLDAHWRVIQIPPALNKPLVLADRPVVFSGNAARSFLMTLPISPTRIFFAFNHPKTGDNLDAVPPLRFVRRTNTAEVKAAHTVVYGTNDAESQVVRCHLRKVT